jgi:hypothetical protein
VLVEEFCYGAPLIDFILKAIREGARGPLFQKLTALAYFLATAHNRTATGDRVDFNRDSFYFDRIVNQLKNWGHVGRDDAEQFHFLKDRWRERGFMWEDNLVFVHGDATPTNFLFGDGLWVIAIDLERMKLADRVFDVGRLVGEIKHFFMQYAGDGDWRALYRSLPLGICLPFPIGTAPSRPSRAASRFTWGSRFCASPVTRGLPERTGDSCWMRPRKS